MGGQHACLLVLMMIAAMVTRGHCQALTLTLSARDLKPGDAVWGSPDPFVRVSQSVNFGSYQKVGETATLHTNNPDWTEQFHFTFDPQLNQQVQFEVIENDAFFDDYYGVAYYSLQEIFEAPGSTIEREFSFGRLIIKKS